MKTMCKSLCSVLVLLGLLLATGSTAAAKIRKVCLACPYPTIQDAINASNSGDTIIVADGTYGKIDFLNKNLVIKRKSAGSYPIIDADNNGSAVTIAQGQTSATTLDGFLITNGNGTAGGWIGTVGGGMMITNNSSPLIKDCIITNNNVILGGGGIWTENGAPVFTKCTIKNNTAGFTGGGVHCWWDSKAIFDDCTISGNSAGRSGGGMIINQDSNVTVKNSIISGNSTTDDTYDFSDAGGGGIDVVGHRSSTIISNCTISGNYSSGPVGGGGILCYQSAPQIRNSIVYNNAPDDISQVGLPEDPKSPILAYSDFFNYTGSYQDGGYNISTDPLFIISANPDDRENWATWDLHLQSSHARSPCIDAGNNTFASGLDIDGQTRIRDGNRDGTATVDIGADEVQRP